ncbi:NAD-dependent glycerol-3-phosphate dehydrogenase family protein [[Clostridium] sordellii ATCC 9714]|nr:NAD-dependent glycerol-3-phosphate dehydrogenase family protein [[Clostridium] sordellii ATCC 9714] [Paeniclostridium sordellii ATCC 9714]
MAKAMIGGIVKSSLVDANKVTASDLNENALENAKKEYGINVTTDSKEVVKNSDIVVVAVKPNVYDIVLEGVKDLISDEKIIVTIAAGKTIESIENVIGKDKKVIRTMPNTPALVNEGMSAICKNKI